MAGYGFASNPPYELKIADFCLERGKFIGIRQLSLFLRTIVPG
jgi:hypothetical protein